MTKLIIPNQNYFDERAKQFSQTALGEKLQRKYTPKPFEERWKTLYVSAWIGSFFCNVVAIITGSTFVFSYALGLVARLPHPFLIAGAIAGITLIGLEALKQITVPALFQDANQYGFKKGYVGRLFFILMIFGVSFVFNYFGGFDFIEVVSTPPQYVEPKQKDISKIRLEYNGLIKQAEQTAENYRNSKMWKGKLSDIHAKIYAGLLQKKQSLTERMLAKIDTADNWNDATIRDAKKDFKEDVSEHKTKLKNKGNGLAWFSVGCEFLMILCFWYREFYEWQTAKQYGQIKNFTPDDTWQKTTTPQDNETNATNITEQETLPQTRDIETQKSKGVVNTTRYNYTTTQKTQTQGTDTRLLFLDKYTVEHNGKRYKLGDVNRFINTYTGRYNESLSRGDTSTAESRKVQLEYWKEKQVELLEKISKNG